MRLWLRFARDGLGADSLLGIVSHERKPLAGLLGFALAVPHTGIETARGEQLGVSTTLDDRAVVEDDDLVGLNDGGQAVRNHQGGAIARDPIKRILDFALGVAVERGGCLIEQQDRRRLEDGARDGDPLLLAAG